MWILGLKGLISHVEKSSNSEHFVGMTPNQTVKSVCVCVLEMEFQAKSFLLKVKCTLLYLVDSTQTIPLALQVKEATAYLGQ